MAEAETWKALTQIEKIVGKKYNEKKIAPALKAFNSSISEFNTAADKFAASSSQMEKTLLALENANSKSVNALKQVENMSAKETFGLTESEEDKRKLKQCQDLLQKAIDQDDKEYARMNKTINELDKHLNHLSDYDPSK